MHGEESLIGIVLVVLAALLCGIAMERARQPAVVGYILAGVILGPSSLGLVGDRENVAILAELGVLMLLFLVGMELSLRHFRSIWKVAIGTVLLQIGISVALMGLFSWALGWSWQMTLLLGFIVALSSTAVVVKMLEAANIIRQPVGGLTIGVLIGQDLAVVPIMLAISAMAPRAVGEGFDYWAILKIVASIGFLVALILYLSRRRRLVIPYTRVLGEGLDLTPLAGLVLCFGGAALSGLLGMSPVFGAFLAGLVVGNSNMRRAMIHSTHPIQSVLLMVFFLSIGLLIDLRFIWDNLGAVLLLLFFVTVVKTVMNIGILRLLGEPWPHAFIAGVLLAQIGEFSFILNQMGTQARILTESQGQLILAVTALSLLASPLWLTAARRLLRVVLLGVTSFQGTVDAIRTRRVMMVLSVFRKRPRLRHGMAIMLRIWLRRAKRFVIKHWRRLTGRRHRRLERLSAPARQLEDQRSPRREKKPEADARPDA